MRYRDVCMHVYRCERETGKERERKQEERMGRGKERSKREESNGMIE